jgi:hypothetical protein
VETWNGGLEMIDAWCAVVKVNRSSLMMNPRFDWNGCVEVEEVKIPSWF